jgi:hypothetical protein
VLGQPIFADVRETPWDRPLSGPVRPVYEALFPTCPKG